MEKLRQADPNANQEWTELEVQTATWLAPDHLVTPLILARHQGYRGQTCAAWGWNNYVEPQTGKAFSIVLRKNNEPQVSSARWRRAAISKPSTRCRRGYASAAMACLEQ